MSGRGRGRDVCKDLDMVPAPVDGGLEPQLLAPTRQAVRAQVAGRVPAYTPEWTSRRPDDAGLALVHAYGTLAETVNVRINHVPRKLALDHIGIAGVRHVAGAPGAGRARDSGRPARDGADRSARRRAHSWRPAGAPDA